MIAYSYIYLIFNTLNGKGYIGRTTNPRVRWSAHKRSKSTVPISRAIQKYGIASFTFHTIYTSFSLEDVLEKETYFIKLFNTHVNDGWGYNATYSSLGNERGNVPWNKGRSGISEETRMKMSMSKRGKPPWNKGKQTAPPSQETKDKLRLASKLARERKFWSTKKCEDSVSALPTGAPIT